MQVHIQNITFNDGTTIPLNSSDIVIFTGANNSGKSQTLRDITTYFTGGDSSSIIVSNIEKEICDEAALIAATETKGNTYFYKGYPLHSYKPSYLLESNRRLLFSFLHKLFINHLSTENRLTASNPVKSINCTKDKPEHPLHVLYGDDEKAKIISGYFYQAFGKSCIINKGAGSIIPMHIGEKPSINPGEDRVSTGYLKRLNALPQIQTQGDGMRSFLGILLEVFSGEQSIILLDEPEAFLHPPQARLLGKILAQNTPIDRQLFLSTHSEDFLKGILESTNNRIKVVRLKREDDINRVSILDNNAINEVWKDPILRYSNIFSGLFHSKVIICESDADCRFYQAMVDVVAKEENLNSSADILFVQCGGKHRLSTLANALKALNVNVAIVADIDLLSEEKTFNNVLDSLAIKWDKDLDSYYWEQICKHMKTKRPSLSKSEIKKTIDEMFQQVQGEELSKSDVDRIKKSIKPTTAWYEAKKTGVNFFGSGEPYSCIINLIDICSQKGLFILKYGELECFCRSISEHGPTWVNKVLEEKDLKQDPELRDAREFAKALLSF